MCQIDIEELSGHAANRRVCEVRHHRAKHVGPVEGGCIGKEQDLPPRQLDGGVLRGRLPQPLRLSMQAHPERGKLPGDRIRAVRGAIGRDDELQLLLWIVQHQSVCELCRQCLLFVVGRDDNADRGPPASGYPVRSSHGAGTESAGDGQEERVAGIGVGEQEGARPEDNFGCSGQIHRLDSSRPAVYIEPQFWCDSYIA